MELHLVQQVDQRQEENQLHESRRLCLEVQGRGWETHRIVTYRKVCRHRKVYGSQERSHLKSNGASRRTR